MVKTTDFPLSSDGQIDLETWLQTATVHRSNDGARLIRNACLLGQLTGDMQINETGESCLQRGIEVADLLLKLGLGSESIAVALIYESVQFADLHIDDVREHLGEAVAKLLHGVQQMDEIQSLVNHDNQYRTGNKADSLKRMLLAMVDDVRVVVIKLAERTCVLRAAHYLDKQKRARLARETFEIYAPLAHRLGVSELKWEMEDLAFRYLYPEEYKKTANLLAQRRIDRENYVEKVKAQLGDFIASVGIIHAEITGRPKHIYSIYRKMSKKHVDFEEIYDVIAMRVLVDTIEDCYKVLAKVHEHWDQIPKEFDDYIAKPKANGYRSIHTAVIGPDNKNVEVQIRTYDIHKECELGFAAHWRYKEGGGATTQQDKITWLRQVLSWQKELAESGEAPLNEAETQFIDNQVYIFTPAGDVMNLQRGATPLDFAYHIHSEIGHRCRGAKINGSIVPLTYALKTGDQVEVITTRHPKPSRDWINPHLGYLKTSRAKAKVLHWFKHQDFEQNIAEGKTILEQELSRLDTHLTDLDLESILKKFNFKKIDDLYAAIGRNDVKLGQLLNFAKLQQTDPILEQLKQSPLVPKIKSPTRTPNDIHIEGIGNLLSTMAKCCQPLPGDPIAGYITVGRGVSIHRRDCQNFLHAIDEAPERFIEVEWGDAHPNYPVNLIVHAHDRRDLIRDITSLLSELKVNLLTLHSVSDTKDHSVQTLMTIELNNLDKLSLVMDRLRQLSNVISIKRQSH